MEQAEAPAAQSVEELWASLEVKGKFSVPPRQFSGERGPQVLVVRECREDGSRVVVYEGKRTKYVARLRPDEQVEVEREQRRGPYSRWSTLGPPSAVEEKPEVTDLPPEPADPHEIYTKALRSYRVLEDKLSSVRGPKAKKTLAEWRAIVTETAELTSESEVPDALGRKYSRAVRAAREYLHQRNVSTSQGERAKKASERSEQERSTVQEDTPIEELPTPEPSAEVKGFSEALEIFTHISKRRLVDAVTISNYPIGKSLGGLPAPRGHMHASVEFAPNRGANGAWRTVTQTTDKTGRLCNPKKSTYSEHPSYVVEPQQEERGVFLEFGTDWVALRWVNGKVETQFRAPPEAYRDAEPDAESKDAAHALGLKAVAAIRELCEQRRVAVRVEAGDLDELLEKNRDVFETVLERKAALYSRLLAEVESRFAQVSSVADPSRLGSQKRRSHETAIRKLTEAGVNPTTGERTGGGTLSRIEELFRRHHRELPGSETEQDEPKELLTGEARFEELTKFQRQQPRVTLSSDQRRLGQFMTPRQWAYRMAELVGVKGKTVLDPTAGIGRLLDAAKELGASQCLGFELSDVLCAFAARSHESVVHGNFLEVDEGSIADCLLMNPPFTTGGPDTSRIVRRAIKHHWNREGNAGIILANGPTAQRAIDPWRELILDVVELPEDAFVQEGTSVRTNLTILKGVGTDPDWWRTDRRKSLSGHEIKILMRTQGRTIDELATGGITKERVKEVRRDGVEGSGYVGDWIERITGELPAYYATR